MNIELEIEKIKNDTQLSDAEVRQHQNPAAEERVISYILSEHRINEAVSKLETEDFTVPICQDLFKAMKIVDKGKQDINQATVYEAFTKNKEIRGQYPHLSDSDVMNHIDRFDMRIPRTDAEGSVNLILENASARRSVLGAKIVYQIYSCYGSEPKARAIAEEIFYEYNSDRRLDASRQNIRELGKQFYKDMSANKEKKLTSTGYKDLDAYIGGFDGGQLIYLAATPGVGKTSLATTIASNVHMEHQDEVVRIFSLEMQNKEVAGRIFSQRAMVNLKLAKCGNLTSVEHNTLAMAISELTGNQKPEELAVQGDYADNYAIDDCSTCKLTPDRLRYELRREKNKIKLVIIDYVQLMDSDERTGNNYEKATAISKELKRIAKEFDTTIVALCQLNREAIKRGKPMMSDMRDSGQFEQDADQVWLLWRPNKDKEGLEDNIGLLEIAKNRSGETGTIKLGWIPKYTLYTDLKEN